MDEPITVTVSHRLGRAEAMRRLQEGLARSQGHLGPMIRIENPEWEGDRLRLRMRALGQSALASIDVLDDLLRIEVSLPWLLARAAKHLLPVLRDETTRLLEKK